MGKNVFFPQIALAIGVLTSNRRGGWLPTLVYFLKKCLIEQFVTSKKFMKPHFPSQQPVNHDEFVQRHDSEILQ